MNKYSYDEVYEACLKYFNGDKLAAGVMIGKYLMRNEAGDYLEKSPDDMHQRIAAEFARIEQKYPNSLSQDVIKEALTNFKYIVPQGSPMFGIGNTQQKVSIANCYVVGQPVDSYGGIFEKDEQLAQIMKRRGGVGIDISTLRPTGMTVQNSARTSDGIGCFMERFSNTTKEVAQNGRRGALMVSISNNHPDIEKFINIKRDLTKVTGANISIRWTDEFLKAVERDEEYTLRFPVDASIEDAKITKVVRAKDIWNQFVQANWDSAEPGCLFWDTITGQSISDCYADEGFKTISTNPCITGSSLIMTNKGPVPMKELVKDYRMYQVKNFNTDTNEYEYDEIIDAALTRKNADVITLEFDDGETLTLTPDHLVFTENRGYVKAASLTADDILISMEIVSNIKRRKIAKISVSSNEDVYDITTLKNGNFFANGTLVHNCGEIPLSEYGACMLQVLNLTGFIDNEFEDNASFNWERFDKYIKIAVRLMDDMIDIEVEKCDQTIDKIISDPEPESIKARELKLWQDVKSTYQRGRRVGLGITALGDMLAMLNLRYGSDESIKFVDEVFKRFQATVYLENSVIASERGTFPIWNWEKEKDCHYIKQLPQTTQDHIQKHGRRNIAMLTCAPTGSVSILTQTSSGIEPIFKRSYTRNRKMTQQDRDRGVTPAYKDSDGIEWLSFEVLHHGLEKWKQKFPNRDISSNPYIRSEAGELEGLTRVTMQSTLQRWIDHSISATCNVKADITVEQVNALYMAAWKQKCKGFTIYREGSRMGVLVDNSTKTKPKTDEIQDNHAPSRPKVLECDIVSSAVNGTPWIFFISKLSGRPYDIFGGKKNNIEIAKKHKSGWIVKNGKKQGRRTYDLYLGSLEDSEERMIIKDIASEFSADSGSFTRILSALFRHGVPLKFIAEQLRKDNNEASLYTFEKVVARILTKYIKDGETSGETCSDCGSTLVYSDGCVICKGCGKGKCQ